MSRIPGHLAVPLALVLLVSLVPVALAGISAEFSVVTSNGGGFYICPQGDGRDLEYAGATIQITVRDENDQPVVGLPADQVTITGGYSACSSSSLYADAPTDAQGMTTLTGTIPAGGWSVDGLQVVAQGVEIGAVQPIYLNSPDINGDGVVDLVDLGNFTLAFLDLSHPLRLEQIDYYHDDAINMVDLAIFAQHFGHRCE